MDEQMTPHEAADAIERDDREHPGSVELTGRVRILIDHARATSPTPEGGELAAVATDERVRRIVAGLVDQAWRAGVSGELGGTLERVDAFTRAVVALASKGGA